MLIEKLVVRKTYPENSIIRNIDFKLNGLNLIVDNTSNTQNSTGNSVGKTTAIKVIDLCLGAKSPKILYFDKDTKAEYKLIKDFIEDNKIEAELVLIDGMDNHRLHIVRQLFSGGKRFVNGKLLNEKDFASELKKYIFGLEEKYPTFRELIPKFLRTNDATSDNMLRFLDGRNSGDKYDTIYSFLFRLTDKKLLSKRDELIAAMTKCEKQLYAFKSTNDLGSIELLKQQLSILNEDLKKLKEKRGKCDHLDIYKDELKNKRDLANEIQTLEEQLETLEFEVSIINKSIKKLESEKSLINVDAIKNLYHEVKLNFKTIEKDFNDVILFHNKMIQNRIKFISKQKNEKEIEVKRISQEIDILVKEKNKIAVNLLDEGLLDELMSINKKIEEAVFKKGRITEKIELITNEENKIKNLEKQIAEINKKNDLEKISIKIKKFNMVFSSYCEKMYNEKYVFAYNSEWKSQNGKFPVEVDNTTVGAGKKKAIIAAFDLAYVTYAQQESIKAPQFVIHDKLENTHIHQLKTIFELCQEFKGQYIIPILRERIDKVESKIIEKAKILELSTDDKFFKVK